MLICTRCVRLNTAKMSHECDICHKVFPHERTLKRHLKIHEEKEKSKCPHCDFATSRIDNLIAHLVNVHHMDRPSARLSIKENLPTPATTPVQNVAVAKASAEPATSQEPLLPITQNILFRSKETFPELDRSQTSPHSKPVQRDNLKRRSRSPEVRIKKIFVLKNYKLYLIFIERVLCKENTFNCP